MERLFSYRVRRDKGAAPNPFWGPCTLVICKPQIRRAATVGDWVVSTGSANSPVGDLSAHLVYAMRVSRKLTMREYGLFAREHCPGKIPDWSNPDPLRRLGDAIYDFSFDPPRVRKSVHTEAHRARDLGGRHAMISDRFYYFGREAPRLPQHLLGLVPGGRAYQSDANQGLLRPFLDWLDWQGWQPNQLYGAPQVRLPAGVAAEVCGPVLCPPGGRGRERPTGPDCGALGRPARGGGACSGGC
ncbi:MAG TPA: hypothetical protein VFE78_01580 [Gemmataceae bacterium]|jgi:hypothetical protein|nr:hypothetical protein [Gemmataceae bacterium]